MDLLKEISNNSILIEQMKNDNKNILLEYNVNGEIQQEQLDEVFGAIASGARAVAGRAGKLTKGAGKLAVKGAVKIGKAIANKAFSKSPELQQSEIPNTIANYMNNVPPANVKQAQQVANRIANAAQQAEERGASVDKIEKSVANTLKNDPLLADLESEDKQPGIQKTKRAILSKNTEDKKVILNKLIKVYKSLHENENLILDIELLKEIATQPKPESKLKKSVSKLRDRGRGLFFDIRDNKSIIKFGKSLEQKEFKNFLNFLKRDIKV